MAFRKEYGAAEPLTGPVCIHLRSKPMYMRGSQEVTPTDLENGSHHCWCILTQHVVGPDNELVGHHQCSSTRDCHRLTR